MVDYVISERIVNDGSLTVKDRQFNGLQGDRGGAVNNYADATLTLENISFTGNVATNSGGAIFSQGTIAVADTVLFSGNSAVYGGALNTTGVATFTNASFVSNTATKSGGAVRNNGKITIENGDFLQNEANSGGCFYNGSDSTVTLVNCTISGNAANGEGGFANNYGTLQISDCTFSGNTAEKGGAIYNLGRANLKNVTFSGNSAEKGGAIYNVTGYTVTLENAAFLTQTDTIVNKGDMTFAGKITLAGRLETTSAINASGVELVFDISSYTSPNSVAIVNDLSLLTKVASYSVSVGTSQADGDYVLADGVSDFNNSISIKDLDGAVLTELKLGDARRYDSDVRAVQVLGAQVGESHQVGNYIYSLSCSDAGSLVFSVLDVTPIPKNLTVSGNLLSWTDNTRDENSAYVLELTKNGVSVAEDVSRQIVTQTTGVEVISLPEASFGWRVRLDAQELWATGEEFTVEARSSEPMRLNAVTNNATDIFFAKIDGIWSDNYFAKHVGVADGWNGTEKMVALSGKSRITDVFSGSEDASILLLDAFGENSSSGVALFLDDIYSAAPDTAAQARIAGINEICGSDGDDVIDLTSRDYAFAGGVTVHGGAGNDVIWANSGENVLFGGAGNDSIVGGIGNDIIDGGVGDDTLHGGGGQDTFCFYGDWGQDTVEQLAEGSVTLCFAEGNAEYWNAETLTYNDGVNSVTVTGVASAEIIFNSELAKFAQKNCNSIGLLEKN